MPMPQPLKLMFICAGNGGGGAEKNFLRTCQSFIKLGADKIQLVPVVRRNTWLAKRLQEEKIDFKTARFGGLFDFFTKPYLKRLIKSEKPNIVQCWMNRATSMTPKVDGVMLIGRLGGYYKLKNYRHADHLIANAKGIISYIINGGWSPSDTSQIENIATLPPANFSESRSEVRKHYNFPEEAIVLFSASRLHPHKGQATVLRALTQLPDNVYYLMAATGPDEQMLRTLAEQLGVSHRVRFAGWVNNISPLCAAADIFVASSRVEPLGNVILDAWAHGMPLVTSNASGPAEIVEDGTNGLIYPIDDDQALATKIKLLINEPGLAQGIAAAGYQHVRTHYSEDAIIAQYLALYERLLTEQGNTK